jgi:hypothetical protein
MSLYITRSTRSQSKRHRVVHLFLAILATLALFITASPSLAATPQPHSTTPAQSPQAPNATCPPDGQCFADVPSGNPFYTFINRIYQQDLVTGYPCGGLGEPCDPESRPYYRPVNNVTRQQMAKFIDNARRLPAIYIETASSGAPIYVSNTVGISVIGASSSLTGVYGLSNTGSGVYGSSTLGSGVSGNSPGAGVGVDGHSDSGPGVVGLSTSANGVSGLSTSGYGVRGYSVSSPGVNGYSASSYGVEGASNTNYGVRGTSNGYAAGVYGTSINGYGVVGYTTSNGAYGVYGYSSNDRAGYFVGNVQVTGNLSKGGGSFKIDDPLDPANKYLYHSFVESPDMMNVYNGNVTTDAKGEATIQLPEWFEALNRDFRYQLTIMGDQFAQARVSSKVKANHFSIKTDKPNVEVSWQVTGIRQDPYANAHRIPVEEDKPNNEKGKYLHPTEWGQPESAGIDYEQQQKMQEAPQATVSKP